VFSREARAKRVHCSETHPLAPVHGTFAPAAAAAYIDCETKILHGDADTSRNGPSDVSKR